MVGLVLMLTGAVAVEVAHNVKNAQNERVDTRERLYGTISEEIPTDIVGLHCYNYVLEYLIIKC